jgi:origin recognition complex subunit 4
MRDTPTTKAASTPKAATPKPAPKATPKAANGTASKPTPARRTPAKKETPAKRETPAKKDTPKRETPSRPPAKQDDEETPRSGKRVAASLAAARTAKKPRSSLPSFDAEVFGSPTGDVSSEAFRANERLRRQREARNFTFEGDAHAPRTTRSGRVVATRDYGRDHTEDTEDTEEKDEYGGIVPEPETEEEDAGVRLDVPLPESRSESPSVAPLPATARPHVLRILATLTGTEREPAPFEKEEDNEALQGLVALLKGTVERGEGNSALVTGPRGVGKTRVSGLCDPGHAVPQYEGHVPRS